MNLNRSGYYKWRNRIYNPSSKMVERAKLCELFKYYHSLYPSHGYRWLNAFIRNKLGLKMSNVTAHRICKKVGIVSKAKHYRYKKPGEPYKVYPNLLLAGLNVNKPFECIVSDMTAFYHKGIYYELTLYMDTWNNEIISHSLSSRKGDRMTYINGLNGLIEVKKEHPGLETVLHTDQGSVYSSKAFNDLLPLYNIIHSMSRAGTPTDNAIMESVNGWIKAELFMDLHVTADGDIKEQIKEYIRFFNEERPAYSLNYMTPKEYKRLHLKE